MLSRQGRRFFAERTDESLKPFALSYRSAAPNTECCLCVLLLSPKGVTFVAVREIATKGSAIS
jgi:hypothetical protein